MFYTVLVYEVRNRRGKQIHVKMNSLPDFIYYFLLHRVLNTTRK